MEWTALIGLLADALMALMLAVTIFFCFKLNRRIMILQDSKGDMAQLIRKFDETTIKASESISELQKVRTKLQDEVSEHIQKANFVADDLAFMIDRGKKVAQTIKQNTTVASAPAEASSRPSAARSAMSRMMGVGAAAVTPTSPDEQTSTEQAASAAMNATTARPNPSNNPPPATGRVSAVRQRSKAEEELLAALRQTPDT